MCAFSGSAVFQNGCALFCAHAYHTPMQKTDAQFFRIFPQFFVADALFYVVDAQFYVKLLLFVMFKKFLPKITILIKIVVYLCVVFQGWLLFPLCHV